jgi:hypothetical protein
MLMKPTTTVRQRGNAWAKFLLGLVGLALLVLVAYVTAGPVAACAVAFFGGLIALQVWVAASGGGQGLDEFVLKRPPDGG